MINLYHYTSVDGFEGIVKNNSIRMTKSEFLNDPYDCHLFVKLVEKYLDANESEINKVIGQLSTNKVEVTELYKEKDCNLIKLDIENPIIRINTAFKGCSSLEKISVLPRIYHN